MTTDSDKDFPFGPDKPYTPNVLKEVRGGEHDGRFLPAPASGVLVLRRAGAFEWTYWYKQKSDSLVLVEAKLL